MSEVGGRGLGDAVDLMADPGKAVLDAGNDGLNLLRAVAGILGAQGRLAALVDEAADLAVQPANGIADLLGGLARRLGEALHFTGDDRKASSGGTGTGRLDGRIERQKIGLFRDRLDRTRDFGDVGERLTDGAQAGLDAADG